MEEITFELDNSIDEESDKEFVFSILHPNLPHDLGAFQQNAVEKIKRLRNHPSIAVWCGDN